MGIAIVIVIAVAVGTLAGWIYAGFPVPRRANSPTGAGRPAHALQATEA